MHFRRRNSVIIAGVVMGVVLLVMSGLLWESSEPRQLQKPVMDGQPINYWLQRMGLGEERVEIRQRLVSIGPRITAPLLAALNDKPLSRRQMELRVKLTNLLHGRLPAVQRWLWGHRPSARWMAAYTLAEMPPDPKIRDALISVLAQARNKDEDSNIGFCAVEGLRTRYTNDAEVVVAALRGALRAPHDNIQAAAACALPTFGPYAYRSLPDIIALASVTNSCYLAGRATVALGEFGPVASNALPALSLLLTNADPTVRRQAAVARWKIAPQSGFPGDVFRWNMKHARLQERWLAAEELWELDRRRAGEAIEGLLGVIQSVPDVTLDGQPFHGVRWGAAETLGRMGVDAATALPVLSAVAKGDSDQWMRQEAAKACERIERAVSAPRLTNGLSR